MKNILITGTSSGIGAIIAQHLIEHGYNVIGTSRKGGKPNNKFRTLQLDVTDDNSVTNLVHQATTIFGKIDVLINNAGMGIAGAIEDISIEAAKRQLDTNYFGVVRMTKAILPHMRANNKGLIINISSMAGLMGIPFQAHYAASKFALEGFTESLRYELLPFNIQVTNLNPGDFKTDFTQNRSFAKTVSPAYQSKFHHMMQLFEEDERNGANPVMIAKLVQKIIQKPQTTKVRYVVGKKEQTIFVALKRWIGDNLFEKVAKSIWKL